MDELEFDEFLDDFEDLESLDEINEKTLQQEGDNEGIDSPLEDQYEPEEQEDLETVEDEIEEPLPPKKPRKLRKPVISPDTHPLEAFMITKEFEWGEVTTITKLSKEELLGIIRGDMPTEYQRNRIRLTTGVIV